MPALVRVPDRAQALDRVLVLESARVLVLESALVLAPAQVLVALAWVLDQGQALVKADLDQVVLRDRTALVLVTGPAMTVLVQQTAQAMAPVRAGTDRAAPTSGSA